MSVVADLAIVEDGNLDDLEFVAGEEQSFPGSVDEISAYASRFPLLLVPATIIGLTPFVPGAVPGAEIPEYISGLLELQRLDVE